MPWCPICKTEYREGFHLCSDCGAELVDELEQNVSETDSSDDDWCFLLETNNDYEADIIESLLRSSNIPVLRKDRGAGGYLKIYMGLTNLGIALYIPKSRLEEAQILINLNPENEERKHLPPDRGKKTKRSFFMFWLASIVVGLILAFWDTIRTLFDF